MVLEGQRELLTWLADPSVAHVRHWSHGLISPPDQPKPHPVNTYNIFDHIPHVSQLNLYYLQHLLCACASPRLPLVKRNAQMHIKL